MVNLIDTILFFLRFSYFPWLLNIPIQSIIQAFGYFPETPNSWFDNFCCLHFFYEGDKIFKELFFTSFTLSFFLASLSMIFSRDWSYKKYFIYLFIGLPFLQFFIPCVGPYLKYFSSSWRSSFVFLLVWAGLQWIFSDLYSWNCSSFGLHFWMT